MLTFMPMEEIRQYEKEMQSPGYVPNTAQKRLAEEVTRQVHGEDGLQVALKVTSGAAPGAQTVLDPEVLAEIAKDMPSADLSMDEVAGCKFVDIMVKVGGAPSKGEMI